jgi:hypothetical protein
MREYYSKTEGRGCSDFLAYVLKHSYAKPLEPLNFELTDFNRCIIDFTYMPKNLKFEVTLQDIPKPIIIAFNKGDSWWSVFVFKEKYEQYGYCYEENRWSYNQKPHGIVVKLKPKFDSIHNSVYGSNKNATVNTKPDFGDFNIDSTPESSGCLYIVIGILILLVIGSISNC